MNTNELTEYLSENSDVLDMFGRKVLAHLKELNEERQPARRLNEAQLRRQTEKYMDQFISSLEDQLKRTVPAEYDNAQGWIQFFDDNRIIEELELSVSDMEFSE